VMRLRKNIVRLGLLAALLGSALTASRVWPTQAQDEGEAGDTQKFFLPLVQLGATSHFHPATESWPPQPEHLVAVTWLPGEASTTVRAAQVQAAQAEAVVLNAATVQAALGERFVRSTTITNQLKGVAAAGSAAAEAATTQVVFFSYTRNATIEVTVQAGAITGIKELPANVYQPEPTTSEKSRAISLARLHFRTAGHQRILQLTGYVIQAYAPEGTTGFYDARVLYVTFHEDITSRPEFGAWVDLTNESVIKSFHDQGAEGQ
jgi:hypothetical protein